MTFFERTMVRQGHPRRIIVGIIGFSWVLYFLWTHNWPWATAVAIGGVVLGRVVTIGMHEEQLAQTTLGRILLLHLHPVNILLQISGFAVLLYAFWIHSSLYILVAVSLILLGHMFGWHKVNQAL
jgi:hypothetical protein